MSDETQPAQPAPPPAEPTAPIRYSEDTTYYGAGGVNVVPTVWCAQLMFMTTAFTNEGVFNDVDAVVSVPWPLAKALHEILGMILTQYEKDEGAIIQLPKSFEKLISELKAQQTNG